MIVSNLVVHAIVDIIFTFLHRQRGRVAGHGNTAPANAIRFHAASDGAEGMASRLFLLHPSDCTLGKSKCSTHFRTPAGFSHPPDHEFEVSHPPDLLCTQNCDREILKL